MLENDPVPPGVSYTISGGYPAFSQYISPITAPGPISYPLYPMTAEPPLTEERLRQIIREELARYFDEGNDVLAVPAKQEDYPFFSIQKELHEALLAVGTIDDDPLPEQDSLEQEQRSLASFPEDETHS